MSDRKELVEFLKSNILPTVVFGALLVTALIYLEELRGWFSLSSGDEPAAVSSAAPPAGSSTVPGYTFSDPGLAALKGALASYENVRAKLADDSLDGVESESRAIAEWVRKASASVEGPPETVSQTLLDAGVAADRLAAASDIAQARKLFGELSRAFVSLASSDPRLQEGQHIFECPMKEGFNKWLQPNEDLANPYMGKQMLQCGGDSEFAASPPSAVLSHEGHGHEGGDVAFYTCSMHPSVKESEMGKCPICSMDLTPVTYDEYEGGVVLVDSVRRQRIGVRIKKAQLTPMKKRIRTVGKLTYDETKLHDITLKYRGWVEKLYANKLGQKVKRGQPLFAVYSPEIYAAQGDLITALDGPSLFESVDGSDAGGDEKNPLADMARERLHLLDAYGVERYVKKTGKPVRYITIASPTTGYVVEKNVVDGSAFAAGAKVMRIAGLDTVWVDAELYESEIPLVEVGQKADIRLTHVPNERYRGKLTYIYPYLDPKTRTGKARVELKNPELALKPDMYANVTIEIDLGVRLTIPESAVIFTGRRRLVFVDIGEGRLRPTEVTLGVHAEGQYEVIRGLKEGDQVVTSGNFLVAAESRIRSAATYWGGTDEEPPPPPEPATGQEEGSSAPPSRPSPKRAVPPTKGHVHPAPKTAPRPRPKPKSKPDEAPVYTCPMHPQIQQPGPGQCPICNMDLVPKGK